MIGVCTDVPGYRVATAELPVSAHLASRAEGAIVAVRGDRQWVRAAHAALAADAAAVVISDPGPFADDDCASLQAVAAGRPIIVDRPLLRADAVESVIAQKVLADYVVVDAAAATRRRAPVTREAVGWMRVLLGGACELRSAERTSSAGVLLVQRVGVEAPGALTATTITGADEGAWIRAVAVSGTRLEVLIDEADSQACIDVADADGIRRIPRRFETHERLSLRRAIDAVASPEGVTDLADLRADAAIANALREDRADKQH